MRIRKKAWVEQELNSCGFFIKEPEKNIGKWNEIFKKKQSIHLELGCGKGQFIAKIAAKNPNINYIGIELFDSVIVCALERIVEAEKPANLRLLKVNGAKLQEYFAKGDVARVYLNFSDPWPKKRHAKRRLTHEGFLKLYESVLIDNGEIHFKTDNRGLFEYSLVSMNHYGMRLNYVSLDLHAEMPEDNIMTEYEEKFSAKGQPIYRLESQFLTK